MQTSNDSSSKITLLLAPSPPTFLSSIAILICLAFSGDDLHRWWAATPADSVVATPEDIPPHRLSYGIRAHARRELKPDLVVVTALFEEEVAGLAVWTPPKRLWRTETMTEFLYRKFLTLKDACEDIIFPRTWIKVDLEHKFYEVAAEYKEKYLGPDNENDTWYLQILAVHPKFQRKGIGGVLLDWGLDRARDKGERAYVEASEAGIPLYIKKGFIEVGSLVVGDGELVCPCLLWPSANQGLPVLSE